MSERRDSIELFRRATGFEPYDYQRVLSERVAPPEVIEVPTGAGKTFAALIPWLADPAAPRRLVYALPMRSLVEQTADIVRAALVRSGDADAVPVHVLMGGVDAADWRLHPDRRMVLIGTIDMLLSRAVNRGYGESRFAWPVAFGLLSNDCRWVFDEVQLMGPARTTSAQLAGLRRKLGTALPAETLWMSATVDHDALRTFDHDPSGDVVRLSDADRAGPLSARLNAVKVVTRVDIGDVRPNDVAKRIAGLAGERHRPGTRTLIVVNRVDTAQAIHALLAKQRGNDRPDIALVHSRYRPADRATQMAAALAEPGRNGMIVVATQVVEAGIDMSSACLITETAPFSSMVQRLGRCNRAGEHTTADVVWLDRGHLDGKAAAPYDPADLASAAAAFAELVGESASPALLEQLDVAEARPVDAVLRRVDLLDLFDTAPDLSGADVDVAPFIRPDDDRSVSIFFRSIDGQPSRLASESRPGRDELVTVPVTAVAGRTRWTFDHVDGEWVRENQRVIPGTTVLLAARDGGYQAERGWTGDKNDIPILLEPSHEAPESFDSDDGSVARAWVTIAAHLADAAREASLLVEELPAGLAAAVRGAAALHDVGKAHPSFQAMLLGTIADEDARHEQAASGLWAKSAHAGGRHVRPHFRHELASALAMDSAHSSLVRYLVAAHHGRVRMSIRPAPGEAHPLGEGASTRFALGVCDGDELPSVSTPLGAVPACVLDLTEMELGGGWSAAAADLLQELGPFRLSYLEALVRIADWRASA